MNFPQIYGRLHISVQGHVSLCSYGRINVLVTLSISYSTNIRSTGTLASFTLFFFFFQDHYHWNSLESSPGRLVIVADLGFPVWRCSFDGEIVGESCGFQLVGDSIAAFLRSCFATTKILALMRVLGGCVSSSREVVVSVFSLWLCLNAPCL